MKVINCFIYEKKLKDPPIKYSGSLHKDVFTQVLFTLIEFFNIAFFGLLRSQSISNDRPAKHLSLKITSVYLQIKKLTERLCEYLDFESFIEITTPKRAVLEI